MFASKEIYNCEAGVGAKLDLSKESVQKALVSPKIRMHCKKIDTVVELEPETLMGYPINLKCRQESCPFNVDRKRNY